MMMVNNNSLIKLGLNCFQFDELIFSKVTQLVNESLYLKELDLSNCHVRPRVLADLIDSLATNTSLKSLSLAEIHILEDVSKN